METDQQLMAQQEFRAAVLRGGPLNTGGEVTPSVWTKPCGSNAEVSWSGSECPYI